MPTIHNLDGAGAMIPLSQAIEMTTRYRDNQEAILVPDQLGKGVLPVSETFDRSFVDTLLAETGAAGLRVYFGMDAKGWVRVLVVAVNADGQDILPSGSALAGDPGGGEVLEEGQRCPDYCPDGSPLNGGGS